MPATLLDGKVLAAQVTARLKGEAEALAARGRRPALACLWAGEAEAAASYRRGLSASCARAGIAFVERGLPGTVGMEDLLGALGRLNDDPAVSGILVQTPLPEGISHAALIEAMEPAKDAEGATAASLGRLLKGDASRAPATARAAFALARASGVPLRGAEAVVVGASETVGRPAALLLLGERATVTVCRSATRDLAAHTRRADVLVVAVGRPGTVTGAMLKPGAVVVDVGINPAAGGRIVGDVDFDSAAAVAGWITPVPGGVGPLTSALLLERVVAAASGLAPA